MSNESMSEAAMNAALEELVASGDAEVVGERDGERRYRLTEKGHQRAAQLVKDAGGWRAFGLPGPGEPQS
jgi:DNA-binding transcriptional regulator PaaX